MEAKTTIRCSVCGGHAAEEALFCDRCGAKLPSPAGAAAAN